MGSEVGVLVHQVVEVRNFPFQGGLVVYWQHLQEVSPPDVGFEPHDVLHKLFVVRTEQDVAVVLVLDEHFHWRLNQCSHSD